MPKNSHSEEKIGERVLCPVPREQTLKITVSTDTPIPQNFRLTISIIDNLLKPDEAKEVEVRPNAPSNLRFVFPENDSRDKFLVKITNSSLATCTIVSIQKAITCPQSFFDEESNICFNSSYQTMLQKSAIIVSKKQYPDGFNLILLGKSNNAECYKKHTPTTEELHQLSMNVTVIVESLKTGLKFDIIVESITSVLVFYLVFLALFYALDFILDKYFGFELDGKYGKIETLVRKNTTEKLQNLVPEQEIESLDQNDGQVCQNELRPEKVPFRFKPPFWFYTQEPWQAQSNC